MAKHTHAHKNRNSKKLKEIMWSILQIEDVDSIKRFIESASKIGEWRNLHPFNKKEVEVIKRDGGNRVLDISTSHNLVERLSSNQWREYGSEAVKELKAEVEAQLEKGFYLGELRDWYSAINKYIDKVSTEVAT